MMHIPDYKKSRKFSADFSNYGAKLPHQFAKIPSKLVSVHPEMAIFRSICVGLRISILKIPNVFLWLKFSPALILRKLSHFWMDTSYIEIRDLLLIRSSPCFQNPHALLLWSFKPKQFGSSIKIKSRLSENGIYGPG